VTTRPSPVLPGLNPLKDFHILGQDSGLQLLAEARTQCAPAPAGTIAFEELTRNPKIRARWARHRAALGPLIDPPETGEYLSCLAVAGDLIVANNALAVEGKWLLSGPAGARAVGESARSWKRKGLGEEWQAVFAAHFLNAAAAPAPLALWEGDARPLDFVIEARNLNNFFHFTKEVLCYLTLLDDIPGWRGRVKIVSGQPMSGFAAAWIEALFPELADRIDLVPDGAHFGRALVAVSFDFPHYQRHANALSPAAALALAPGFNSGI